MDEVIYYSCTTSVISFSAFCAYKIYVNNFFILTRAKKKKFGYLLLCSEIDYSHMKWNGAKSLLLSNLFRQHLLIFPLSIPIMCLFVCYCVHVFYEDFSLLHTQTHTGSPSPMFMCWGVVVKKGCTVSDCTETSHVELTSPAPLVHTTVYIPPSFVFTSITCSVV